MNQIDWMQNEATQNLRQYIATLFETYLSPLQHQFSTLETQLENWCASIAKERTELKDLIAYIKQYELVKEQEIKNLFSKLEQLETIQEIKK